MVYKMSEFFNSIKQGLNEALEFSEGKCPEAKVHQFSPIDVKNIRKKVGIVKLNFHQLLV